MPAAVVKGSLDDVQRIGAHGWDGTKADDHPGGCRAYVFCVAPHLAQVCCKVFRARVNDLGAMGVVDSIGAAHEPVTEPLIGDVGPYAIVRGRGDHPVEPGSPRIWPERLGFPAVRQSHATRRVESRCIVALRPPFDDGKDIGTSE